MRYNHFPHFSSTSKIQKKRENERKRKRKRKRENMRSSSFSSSLLFLVRLLAVVDFLLLLLTLLHFSRSKSYFSSLQTQVQLEHKNRLKWETYLKKYRTKASEKVSREMQVLMLEKFREETEKCPPEPKCEKFKPCSKSKSTHHKDNMNKKISSKEEDSTIDVADDEVRASNEEETGQVAEVENSSNNGEIENKHYFDVIPRYSPGPASPTFEPASNDGVSFKIFVYNLPQKFHVEMLKKNKRCVTDQYGTEIRIHANIMQSKMYTLDPLEAEFFYVPVYGECKLFENIATLGAKKGLQETNTWWLEAMKLVTDHYPFWNRTQGRDHVFTFAGARGPHIFKDWKRHIKKSVFLTPEGDRSLSEQFNTWKDIVIPGLEPEKAFWSGSLRRQKEVNRAKTFAYFRGTIANKLGKQYSKGIRIKMKEAFKDIKDVVFTEQQSSCDKTCYREEMRASTFCLCPRGWSPWTLRAYQALMVGCIPVIIADEIEFPYENSFNWREVSIKIPEKRHLEAIDILRSVPDAVIERKREAMAKFWPNVAWKRPTVDADAFHSVMKELERKKRGFKASTFTFWN